MKIRTLKNHEVALDKVSDHHFETKPTSELEATDLLSMINQLPMGYKTVFNLYAIEGYSHAEVAKKLGISEGTSKSQLSRARALLQNQLSTLEIDLKKERK